MVSYHWKTIESNGYQTKNHRKTIEPNGCQSKKPSGPMVDRPKPLEKPLIPMAACKPFIQWQWWPWKHAFKSKLKLIHWRLYRGHYVSIAQCAVCAWSLFWSIFYNILLWSIFLKTPLAALKNILFVSPFLLEKVPIRSLFHSKMGPHFYKFRNSLHVVHDALDNIGPFQSVGNLNS